MASPAFEFDVSLDGVRATSAKKGLDELARRVGTAFVDLTPIARKEMRDLLDTVRQAMLDRHSTPWRAGQKLPGGKQRGKLAKRSGSGLASLKTRVTGAKDEVIGSVQVGFPFLVHEDGATIVARRAKFLTIPLPAALDSRGVPLKPKARDWPNTFVQKSRKGNLLIFQKRGGKIIPLYVLKKRVKLKPRLGLNATLEKAAPLFVDRVFDAALRKLQRSI